MFSLEAAVALVVFVAFIAALPSLSFTSYSGVLLYKQAGDTAEIAMLSHCEHNTSCIKGLTRMLGRKTTGAKCAAVTRTAATPDGRFERVVFRVCA